jgi:uncharacterized protein
VLPVAEADSITGRLATVEARTGHQFVVVTVPSLGSHTIEDYGKTLGNYWGIGRKTINDGVLLIVAPNDRKVRIEVGYGLEQALRNDEAATIIDNAILPAFREGDLPRGIEGGVNGVIREIAPNLAKAA